MLIAVIDGNIMAIGKVLIKQLTIYFSTISSFLLTHEFIKYLFLKGKVFCPSPPQEIKLFDYLFYTSGEEFEELRGGESWF